MLEQLLEIIRTDVTFRRSPELEEPADALDELVGLEPLADDVPLVPEVVPTVPEVVPLVPEVEPEALGELELLELSTVPVTSISWPACFASSMSLPSRKYVFPFDDIEDDDPYGEALLVPGALLVPDVPVVPDVPLLVPLVVPLVLPLVELLLPELDDGFAFVSIQLMPAGADALEDDVVPVVPVVPVVLDALLAGCRQPVTVTVLLELDRLWSADEDVPLCAYTATPQKSATATAAPHTFRFMRASFAPGVSAMASPSPVT